MECTIRVYTVGGKFLGEDKIDTDTEEVGEIILDHIEAGNTVIIGEDISNFANDEE